MSNVNLPIQRCLSADIIVIGGGISGLAAAVCAGRRGKSVIVVEAGNCLGGTATAGLVGPFMTSSDPEGKTQVIRGFYDELMRRLAERDGAILPMDCPPGGGYAGWRVFGHANNGPFQVETLKLVADEMCQEAGVRTLFYTQFITAECEDQQIKSVIAAEKGGLVRIQGKIFIDCSGDADLAYAAGVPTIKGDTNSGEMQQATLFAIVDNVEKDKIDQIAATKGQLAAKFIDILNIARANGDLPFERATLGLYENPDHSFRVNMTHISNIDGTVADDLTAGTIEGRKQMDIVMKLLRKYIPGCANTRLLQTASLLGIRETRRIVGKFVMDASAIENSLITADAIGICASSIDIHSGPAVTYIPAKSVYGIPYQILLPQKIDNLLVAGRCVSVSREVLAAIRVMPPCIMMGQAAGNAAVMSVENNTTPAEIDVSKLRERLQEENVLLAMPE